MDYLNNSFYDAYNGIFNEYLSRVERQITEVVPEYNKCVEEEEKILDEYPRLRNVVDDSEAEELNQQEILALIEYLSSYANRNEALKKYMFFKGYQEAYYFFNKMGWLQKKEQCSQ